MITGIDHVGIAVTNLNEALKMYDNLFGMKAEVMPFKQGQAIKSAWITLGNAKIEILEAVDPEGRVGKFIKAKGEGIEHIALRTDNVEEDLKSLKKKGVPVIDDKPRPGTGGSMVAFLQAKGVRGTAVQLVERK